jgi:hypothetical protein
LKVALDTNVLAYAEGIDGIERRNVTLDLIRRLPQEATVIPVQVLGELFNVLVRKAGKSRRNARDALLSWRDTFPVVETSSEIMLTAAGGSSVRHLGCRNIVGGVTSRLPAASIRRPAEWLHMGWCDRDQSVRLSAACPIERFVAKRDRVRLGARGSSRACRSRNAPRR